MPILDVRARIAFDAKFNPRMLHRDERAKVVLVCLEPGQQIQPHAEENQGFFFVLEGSGILTCDESELPLQQGQLGTVPFGATRGLRATDVRLVVLATAVSDRQPEEPRPAASLDSTG
jgi:quercetin dioxygenase-like cupin family protein